MELKEKKIREIVWNWGNKKDCVEVRKIRETVWKLGK